MRVGFTYERKCWYEFRDGDSPDANSELLSDEEEREQIEGLEAAGHAVVCIGDCARLLSNLEHWRDSCDIVFNRSVGYRGTDRKSTVPALLEAAGIPYVGSTPYVLTLTRHKYHAKLVVGNAGVITPPAAELHGGTGEGMERVVYPAIVKPVAESSSIGIECGLAIVSTPEAARERARVLAARYGQPALVETFVEGIEIEVPVVVDPEPRVLGLAAVSVNGDIPAGTHYLASDEVYADNYGYVAPPSWVDCERVSEAATRAARSLGIRDYGRIDFRVTPDGTPWFIEASTHPHVQRHSGFFFAARQMGMDYHDMLGELVRIGMRRCGLTPG